METERRRSLRARENHGGSEVTEVEDLDEAMGNTDGSASEESEGDPTYDVLEETRLSLSKISIKKTRKRFSEEKEPDSDGELESMDLEVPELNQKEKKCFEKVEMIIRDGQLEKLKVDECKVYLRKYGLRLIGNKDVLIARIREHLEVMDGGGEKRYPISSFVFDCKGDACTGDVVMFEQNVYDMYSIASRSATGPPCGTRTVVGRIVKESYGAAKQQHTFTIEVLWSKGEKPLPPMHPLLIKGRNLYRIKTMRQKWDDEVERKKTLQEKHSRGFVARCSREKRIEVKEIRKTNRMKRLHEKEGNNYKIPTTQTRPVDSIGILSRQGVQKNQLDPTCTNALTQNRIQNQIDHTKPNSLAHLCYQYQTTTAPHKPIDHFGPENQAQNNVNKSPQQMNVPRSPQAHRVIGRSTLKPQQQSSLYHFPQLHNQRHTVTDWTPRSPSRRSPSMEMYYDHHVRPLSNTSHPSLHGAPSQLHREEHHHRQPLSNLNYYSSHGAPPLQRRLPTNQQLCRYYPLGRCYYGDNCKYLHSER